MNEVKNRLKDLMQGRSITWLHQETGISRQTLTPFYHNQSVNIRFSTLAKICDALQVPLSSLISYEPSEVFGGGKKNDEITELRRRIIADAKRSGIEGDVGAERGLMVALFEIDHLDEPYFDTEAEK